MANNWLAKARRLVTYFVTGIFPFLTFFLGLVFVKDINISAVLAVLMAFIMVWISNLVSSTPWVRIVESDALLCLNISSTGIIEPYLLQVEAPYAIGRIRGKLRKLFFDRGGIFYLLNPKKGVLKEENTTITVSFEKNNYNATRFDLQGVTTFLYNEQLNNFLTKDFFAEKEQQLFLKNQAFSIHTQLEEVSKQLNYYASYINEKLLKGKFLGLDPLLLILAVGIILVAILFGPNIIDLINSTLGHASSSIQGASQQVTAPMQVKP